MLSPTRRTLGTVISSLILNPSSSLFGLLPPGKGRPAPCGPLLFGLGPENFGADGLNGAAIKLSS